MNWKDNADGTESTALASREVGGKYFIWWVERYYSEQSDESVECRHYHIEYQHKGSGSRGNIHRTSIRTLKEAKALAEAHHERRKQLIVKYGDYRDVPSEAWDQFSREMAALQGVSFRIRPRPESKDHL